MWSKTYNCGVEVKKKIMLSGQILNTNITKHLCSWVLADPTISSHSKTSSKP